MAFPGGYAGLPGQQQNAGIPDQEAKMIKMVRISDLISHRNR